MKQVFIALSLVVLFAGCKNSPEKANKTETNELASAIEPVIQGSWVMVDYINDLKNTKSPLASSAKLEGLVTLEIDTKGSTGDSVAVIASLNNHEGDAFYAYMRKGQETNSIATNRTDADGSTYDLGYELATNDTFLILYHHSKDGKLLDKRNYTKWKDAIADYDEPSVLQRFVNSTLIAGKYNVTDDKGKVYNWEFTKGGNLLGVDGHNTYYIFTDFIAEEEGYKIDELYFDKNEKTQKPYIFETKDGKVFFYAATEDKERTKLIKGDLKYTLVKQ